ncbi:MULTISPECIES: hypothetical protein [Streptomyces]|uniref:Uncharacterized protein n=1 Tax=Streptomyces zinciresistens K42 TaxID=700597 RepID=G2GB93_9ACTN|nr:MULTISPECIES: hypothetical protein [Streptomyces]EGX59189.1 hypothetical protein SZN_13836 [Streptomyces zinciresistens K42]MDT9695960.1 hypothetical protein [Streptomyces sp. P17]
MKLFMPRVLSRELIRVDGKEDPPPLDVRELAVSLPGRHRSKLPALDRVEGSVQLVDEGANLGVGGQ